MPNKRVMYKQVFDRLNPGGLFFLDDFKCIGEISPEEAEFLDKQW